jgi:hypothetical protein
MGWRRHEGSRWHPARGFIFARDGGTATFVSDVWIILSIFQFLLSFDFILNLRGSPELGMQLHHVLKALALKCEAPLAKPARERLIALVQLRVSVQRCELCERFFALRAGEAAAVLVTGEVLTKVVGTVKFRCATRRRASVRTIAAVHAHVHVQMTFRAEALAAARADTHTR